jgi:hypothetical protein
MGTLLLLWVLSHTDHASAPTAATLPPNTIAIGKNAPSLLPMARQLSPFLLPPASRDPDTARCDAVIRRVLLLLPRQPFRVVVFDIERTAARLRSRLAHADGFVTKGDPAVYLRKQSPTFQAALAGPGIWDYALAITIWHEMAHLDGADERQAQRREEELWTAFVVAGRVDSSRGMRYLALLRKR